MPRHHIHPILIAAALGLLPGLAAAQTPVASKTPIHISADHFRFNQKKGIGDYLGKVIVTQDKLLIKGDKLNIIAPNNGPIQSLTMTGAPATFDDTTTDGKHIAGQASKMVYSPASQRIVLTGHAQITQGSNNFRSTHIVYDIRRDLVEAGAPGQRIEATFAPAGQTAKTPKR